MYIYILKLEQNKYYVGKSDNLLQRIDQHFFGSGAAWTKMYKPISIERIIPDCDSFDEDKYTKMYMATYGIDNVRGGSYIQINLNSNVHELLLREINGSKDRCFKCGSDTHYVNNCPKIISCDRCGRVGHLKNKCYAKKDINGNTLGGSEYDQYGRLRRETKYGSTVEQNTCDQCGHAGHLPTQCYVMIDVNGNTAGKNICDLCGEAGHLSDQCYFLIDGTSGDINICDLCGRLGHQKTTCHAKIDANGNYLEREINKSHRKFDGGCTRCGRNTHTESECHAKIDYNIRQFNPAIQERPTIRNAYIAREHARIFGNDRNEGLGSFIDYVVNTLAEYIEDKLS